MQTPLAAVLCVVAAGAAFAAGWSMSGARSSDGSPHEAVETATLQREVDALHRQLADERARKARGEGTRVRSRESEAEETTATVEAAAAGTITPAAAPGGEPAAFSLEGVTDAADASKKFMAFVEAQLARGDAGFAAILQALDSLWRDKEKMQALFADEGAASRQLYPWIKLLVERDAQVIDLTEYVFKKMAEDPKSFANTANPNELEIFTEGMGFLMPGAVPADRLARLRGYAEKMLATPESEQPEALRGNRNEIERLLARYWAEPITAEQALEKLKSGDVPPRELVKYLRMAPPDALALIDVTALVAPHVRQGNWDVLRWLGSPPLDHLDLARLDQAALEGVDSGKTNWPQLAQYAQRRGSKQWADVRPFIDRALAQGERTSAAALQVVASGMLAGTLRPDKAYVETLLTRTDVPEAVQNQLKALYDLNPKRH